MTARYSDDAIGSSGSDVLDHRYRLESPLGVGAMAEVFRAQDLLLGREVAVKLFHRHLLDDVSTLERARGEMRVLARLSDPHLVRLWDASFAGGPGRPYLVMELVDGHPLSTVMGEGPMELDRAAGVGRDLAQALSHVHGAGVVHRDVKPANVLTTEGGLVKLADFGIALTGGSRLTEARTVVGTAGYLAPEQIRGADATPASDVHALGLLVLECVTGRREYPGSDVQAAVARLHRAPQIPVTLPGPWRRLLTAMTHDDPGVRPTAAAARDQFEAMPGDAVRAYDERRRTRVATATAAAVVALAALGGGWLLHQDGGGRGPAAAVVPNTSVTSAAPSPQARPSSPAPSVVLSELGPSAGPVASGGRAPATPEPRPGAVPGRLPSLVGPSGRPLAPPTAPIPGPVVDTTARATSTAAAATSSAAPATSSAVTADPTDESGPATTSAPQPSAEPPDKSKPEKPPKQDKPAPGKPTKGPGTTSSSDAG